MSRRLIPARDPNCSARGHSKTSRRIGCICPWRDVDREDLRRRSANRRSGPMRVVVRPGDVDDLVVQFMLDGRPPRQVSSGEREAAVTALTGRGLTAREIADHLRMNMRTVVRYRSAARARAGVASC